MSTPAVELRTQISRQELYNRKANTFDGLSKLLQDGLDPNATILAEDIPDDLAQTTRELYDGENILDHIQFNFYENSRTLFAWVLGCSVQLEPSLKLLIEKGAKNPFHCLVERIINTNNSAMLSFSGAGFRILDPVVDPVNENPIKTFEYLISLNCDVKQEGLVPMMMLLLTIQKRGYHNFRHTKVLCEIVTLFIKAQVDIPIELFREMESEFLKESQKISGGGARLQKAAKLGFYELCSFINEKIEERSQASSSAAGAGDAKSQAEGKGEADTKPHTKDRDEGSLERERKARKEAMDCLQFKKTKKRRARPDTSASNAGDPEATSGNSSPGCRVS